MIHLYVPDVGDGLAAGIYTIDDSRVQIDCGSQQSPARACHDGLMRIHPRAFFLSHFHTDHYNGLLQLPPCESLDIRHVFFPRIPIFPRRRVFLEYMIAMAQRVLGDESGSMEADFLNVLAAIVRRSFSYRSLSAGETVCVEGAHFDVLWPPETLEEEAALAVIRKALDDFETARSEDEELRRLHEMIGERGVVEPYFVADNSNGERQLAVKEPRRQPERWSRPQLRELPEIVVRANDSLRRAANHLSLAFYEDNRFLFLGDLEKKELEQVAARLADRRRTTFFATITPHHGTHWHPSLKKIKTVFAISSVGDRLIRKLCPSFRQFGTYSFVTHSNGNIHVPNLFHWYSSDPRRYWWYPPEPWS